jgi:hypothetical protein
LQPCGRAETPCCTAWEREMPPIVLTEMGLIAIAKAVEAVANYQRVRLETVPEAAALESEWIKPWLALGKIVNDALGIK